METSQQRVSLGSMVWKCIYTVLGGIIVLGALTAGSQNAIASHEAGWDSDEYAYWHNTNMHSTASESICVISSTVDQHISDGTFRNTLKSKLYATNNPPNWDGLANNKVYIILTLGNGTPQNPQRCNDYSQTARNAIPIEAYLAHNVSATNNPFPQSPCTSFAYNFACTSNEYRIWNVGANHWDLAYSYIWFPEGSLYTANHNELPNPQYVINHEFGHVLGLGDGGWPGDTECNTSIMHAGKTSNNQQTGCTDPITVLWPSQSDRDTVVNIVNSVSPAVTIDDANALVNYSGSWNHTINVPDTAWNTLATSINAGSNARYTFTGERISLLYSMVPGGGSSDIYIDGNYQTTISHSTPETRKQVTKTWEITPGNHTIEVRVGGGGVSTIDAFAVNIVGAGPGVYDNTHYLIRYIGPWWSHQSNISGAYNSTLSWSNVRESVVRFTFVGDEITYHYSKAYNRGKAAITIDGINKGYIDLYAPNVERQHATTYTGLGKRVHVITITIANQKNSSSSDYFLDVDRFTVR